MLREWENIRSRHFKKKKKKNVGLVWPCARVVPRRGCSRAHDDHFDDCPRFLRSLHCWEIVDLQEAGLARSRDRGKPQVYGADEEGEGRGGGEEERPEGRPWAQGGQ